MKSRAAACVVLASILYTACANAEINTDGNVGVVRTISAKTMGKATMNIGVGVNFDQSSDYVKGPKVNGQFAEYVWDTLYHDSIKIIDPAKLLSSNLFLSFGILSFWDVAMSLPFYYDWAGFGGLHDGGIGDLEISTKFCYPSPSKRLFYQSYFLAGTVPVGMKDNGLFPRHPYFLADRDTNPAATFYSSQYAAFKGLMLWTFDLGSVIPSAPVQFHLNLGGVVNAKLQDQNNTAIGGLAIEYSPTEFLTVFVDLNGESRWSNFSTRLDPSNDPMLFTPGIHVTTPNGLYLYLAGDFSLSSNKPSVRRNWINGEYAYSTGVIPRYGVQFAFGWSGGLIAKNDDRERTKNGEGCRKDPEDIDGFNDMEGCPDIDNDVSKGLDAGNKCEQIADEEGNADNDGCPDSYSEDEGALDKTDQCQKRAGDIEGAHDADGCPDLDKNKNGASDSIDKCYNNPEDSANFQDNDGCPDIDVDQDGVLDSRNKCSNESEIFNGFDDKDGCPDTIKKEIDFPKQQILNGVAFKPKSGEMTFESFQYIDPLVRALKQYPEVEVEIRAHTDIIGDFVTNMHLTQLRAEAIRQYLISKDISPSRIRATGMGSSIPIADNKTASGRMQNRRIEILRIK